MARRGRPRDTIAQRNRRRRQREARRRELQRLAQLLRNIEARGINNENRRTSLRLECQHLNRAHTGRYTAVLFGEEGWVESDLYDSQVRENYYLIIFEGEVCREYH
jgi:hypothetical protein